MCIRDSGNTGATIIGGNSIKLTGTTYIDHTAVDNLAIFSTPVTNNSNNNKLVWNSTSKKLEINTTAGGGATARNGLTIDGGGYVVLGGALTGDTTVDTTASGFAVAIGNGTTATGQHSFAQGNGAFASGTSSIALGGGCACGANNDIAIGLGAYTIQGGQCNIVIGNGARVSNSYSLATTYGMVVGVGGSIDGNYFSNSGYGSVVLGNYARTRGAKSIAIGTDAYVRADNPGGGSNSGYDSGNVGIGYGVAACGLHTVSIGHYANVSTVESVAIGYTANVATDAVCSIAIGTNSCTINRGHSIAIGTDAWIVGSCNGIAIGAGAKVSATRDNVTIVSANSCAPAPNSTIIGGTGNTSHLDASGATLIGLMNYSAGTDMVDTAIINNLAILDTPTTSSCVSALVWDTADKKVKLNSSLGGGGLSATANGISDDGTTITLGGSLTGDTVIDTNNNGIAFGDGAIESSGNNSFASGIGTKATGNYSQAFGQCTSATTVYAHAQGRNTIACGTFGSHAEGYSTRAYGSLSHAEGTDTEASGSYSHSEGQSTEASGNNGSHAEGLNTIASGATSHAEGANTVAGGSFSHAEGASTCAMGDCSHAEGRCTIATGTNGAHAEGAYTSSCGLASHSQNQSTAAVGSASHAGGFGQGITTTRVFACGTASFNHSTANGSQGAGHGAIAGSSAILGGQNHNIESGNLRAAIIGGDGIKLTGTDYIDFTAVDNLAIWSTPTTSSCVSALVWDAADKKVKLNSSLGGATPGGADTNIQYNNGGVLSGSSNFIYNDSTGGFCSLGTAANSGFCYVGTSTVLRGCTNSTPLTFQVDNEGGHDALLYLSQNNLTTGDPYVMFEGNACRWGIGSDKNIGEKLKIGWNTAPSSASPSSANNIVEFCPGSATAQMKMNTPFTLKSYTVAAATGLTESNFTGAMIYVTNEVGGAVPAFSDGTNWRRVTDRAVIST